MFKAELSHRLDSNCATAGLRQLTARCSGVTPLLSRALLFAPQSSSACAIST